MKTKLVLILGFAVTIGAASQAMALACSDPRATPTPRYNMSPGCEPYAVETPVPSETTPPTRAYCNEQKRACKRAATAKKRATNSETTRKRKFTKQEAKKQGIQSTYDRCIRTQTRKINKLRTSALPTAIACGPSLRDLINRDVTIDFFSCRNNNEVIQDFIIEERNRLLGTIVDNMTAWVRTCALNSEVRSACNAFEELALAAFNGDDLDGLIQISPQCRNAADDCIDDHRAVINRRRSACNKMDKYQRKARSLASGTLRCKDTRATKMDRHHEKLANYHMSWANAWCEKKGTTKAEPVICREYNKRCR